MLGDTGYSGDPGRYAEETGYARELVCCVFEIPLGATVTTLFVLSARFRAGVQV